MKYSVCNYLLKFIFLIKPNHQHDHRPQKGTLEKGIFVKIGPSAAVASMQQQITLCGATHLCWWCVNVEIIAAWYLTLD